MFDLLVTLIKRYKPLVSGKNPLSLELWHSQIIDDNDQRPLKDSRFFIYHCCTVTLLHCYRPGGHLTTVEISTPAR